MTIDVDVLIIGSGAAGLTTALQLPAHLRIGLISKNALSESSTYYAQGGIAAVMDSEDSIDNHIKDTMVAGDNLCHAETIRYVCEHARKSVQWLIDLGVPFTKDTQAQASQPFHLNREGGHSHRRIIHADDATGKAVSKTLAEWATERTNITIYEHMMAIDVIKKDGRVCGAYIYDIVNETVHTAHASAVVLATGGASKVYLYSSNPDVCSGDGIAIAWRAGRAWQTWNSINSTRHAYTIRRPVRYYSPRPYAVKVAFYAPPMAYALCHSSINALN